MYRRLGLTTRSARRGARAGRSARIHHCEWTVKGERIAFFFFFNHTTALFPGLEPATLIFINFGWLREGGLYTHHPGTGVTPHRELLAQRNN